MRDLDTALENIETFCTEARVLNQSSSNGVTPGPDVDTNALIDANKLLEEKKNDEND